MLKIPTSVVVPAYDEAAVIERTLSTLLADAAPGEFDVVVVANGCSDDTAALVRRRFPRVRVLELDEGSKPLAINAGLAVLGPGPVLMLDADVVLDTASARALVAAATAPGVDAAIAAMDIDPAGVSLLVRAFYAAWFRHPYFDGGKFAAAYALSAAGRGRLGVLPRVTADDEYVARRMVTVRTAPGARFRVAPPRTLRALLAVRTRSRRGTAELGDRPRRAVLADAATFAGRLLCRPWLWPAACVYVVVVLQARSRAAAAPAARVWERDVTSRQAVT